MKKLFLLLVVLITTCLLSGCGITEFLNKEEYLIDKYSSGQWKDAGAEVNYNVFTKDITFRKSKPAPAWGGTILEIGAIDLSKDYYLKFDVVDLHGLYAAAIHYGGWPNYERNFVKIQYDTTIKGEQEYNVSEALRSIGLTGKQQIALYIAVIDPRGEEQTAILRLKKLSFSAK